MRLAAGALAGITSVCASFVRITTLIRLTYHTGATYPLDLVRSRLSIATASIPLAAAPPPSSSATHNASAAPSLASAYHTAAARADLTMWGMARRVVREEGGVRALYRGIVATAVGVAPYVGQCLTAVRNVLV